MKTSLDKLQTITIWTIEERTPRNQSKNPSMRVAHKIETCLYASGNQRKRRGIEVGSYIKLTTGITPAFIRKCKKCW